MGDLKRVNQDALFSKTGLSGNRRIGLFIVADGCGGLAFGEEISKLAVTYFQNFWDRELRELLKIKKLSGEIVNAYLDKAIREINIRAIKFGKQAGKQVGTTLSLLFTVNRDYYIKNIGDSRIYLIRKKQIRCLTEDQSLLASMLRNKEITALEAKSFPKKNVLTMCVGFFDDIKIYSNTGKVKSGDLFLLCCDGLYNYVPDDTWQILLTGPGREELPVIAAKLRKSIPPGEARDNVSILLVRFV
jgi:protein phosphatase